MVWCGHDIPEMSRTAKATAAAARAAADRRADWLRERGWLCFPPEHADELNRTLDDAGWERRDVR